jgi:hypothetical protein
VKQIPARFSCLILLTLSGNLRAQQGLDADVVVLDDTSASMKDNDPQNTIVLVTRLLADIVPGKVGAVRLFDIDREKAVVGGRDTGRTQPCPDNPSVTCHILDTNPDALQKVIDQRLLLLTRPTRGDPAFKTKLEDLLRPSAMSTQYGFSFKTISRLFEENASPPEVPRIVVWLSDGATDATDWAVSGPLLKEILNQGVAVRAVVFKTGRTERLIEAGLKPSPVDGSPHDLMKAFADVFRQIVQAPYGIDHSVASEHSFEIKPRMEDVWVIVYGDESLVSASVSGGGRKEEANYASDHYRGSAYRVAYFRDPSPGMWTVEVSGGGSAVSYAVVQRSTITPFIYPPQDISPGVPFRLETSLRSGKSNQDLLPADIPEPVALEGTVDGQTVTLNDDGSNGDRQKGDGRYSAMVTAQRPGPVVITVRAHNRFLDRTVKITVQARGFFRYTGGPVEIDFGSRKAGETFCKTIPFEAEQQGVIPFELRQINALPPHLTLEMRAAGKHTSAGGSPIPLPPGEKKELCLIAGRDGASNESRSQHWVSLSVSGRQDRESIVELHLTWSVRPLTFWEKWGWLILLILGILLIWFIIYGYIRPNRFPAGLAVSYAPALDELDDQTPQPVRMWKGVGIGFYRDARACLRGDFRIDGQVKGAGAILQAGPRRAVIVSAGSRGLYREIGYAEWEQVLAHGRRAGHGETFRIGDSGPYFRLSTRMTA